jgi:hypothetical protein
MFVEVDAVESADDALYAVDAGPNDRTPNIVDT